MNIYIYIHSIYTYTLICHHFLWGIHSLKSKLNKIRKVEQNPKNFNVTILKLQSRTPIQSLNFALELLPESPSNGVPATPRYPAPETNVLAPENWWKVNFLFGYGPFLGAMLVSGKHTCDTKAKVTSKIK